MLVGLIYFDTNECGGKSVKVGRGSVLTRGVLVPAEIFQRLNSILPDIFTVLLSKMTGRNLPRVRRSVNKIDNAALAQK